MIMICKNKCFVLDRSVKPGQSIDIPEAMLESDVVKSSFQKPQSAEEAKAAEESAAKTEASGELTVAEMKRRLDEMGIKYKGNASREALKNILAAQTAAAD